MDEIEKCLDALGLKPGATKEEVQQAYRELAMVWHPDRFAADSPLQAKAHAKVQEINAAYGFLMAHGFKDGNPVSPGQPTPEPENIPEEEIAEPKQRKSPAIWILAVALVAVISVGVWFFHNEKNAHSPQDVVSAPDNSTKAIVETHPPANAAAAIISTNDLLSSMVVDGNSRRTVSAEGKSITGDNWLQTVQEYSPPFVIHAVAKTDLNNIRLVYGKGLVIFNWESNPDELRFHDPATGRINPFAGEGRVPVNEWQDIEWRIDTNYSTVTVNGIQRARITGKYQGMAELAGIRTGAGSSVTVKMFEVRKLPSEAPQKTLEPSAGLVLYYPFETDENGVVTDQSGFKNSGVVHGAKFVRDGKVGGAMSFDGRSNEGDSIFVKNSSSLNSAQRTRQLTICAWIKLNSIPREFPVILSKGGNYAPNAFGGYEINLHAYGDNGLLFISGKYGIVCFHDGEKWFPQHLHEWIHIAVVINATANTGKIYINGRRMDEVTLSSNIRDANFALPNDLIIGAPDPNHHPNRAYFDGLMDELRIYVRALTTEEIRNLPGFAK